MLRLSNIILDLFTATVCGIIAWYGVAFVREGYAYGDTLLGNVPAWIPQLILPVGFALISWRYLVFSIRGMLGRQRTEPVK